MRQEQNLNPLNPLVMVNWSCYLESLCKAYAQWWQVYTITDVVGRKRVEAEPSPLLLDFMVQTVERDREDRGKREEKIERLTVLDGLRKYASEHVLLVGRPGSGKSTALVRLVLEEAKAALTPPPPTPKLGEGGETVSNSLSLAPLSLDGRGAGGEGGKIPVLVELRYYQESVLDLIRNFLKRHQLLLEIAEIERLLFEGQLLLLLDGLNELPSEEARRDLHKFRQDYQKTTPMIFTTRDLGVGGDLEITKKLEMQPLSEAQMQQFVRAYLPQQGEQMLRQLGSRLRELGQTPLLLWMLCSLFKARGKVPPNLGLVFRQFAQSYYDKLKQDVPVSDESRRWCQLSLQHLAWRMTQGREAMELQVAISRQEAEEILTAYLRKEGFAQPRNRAMEWLADLLKYHLLQLGTNNQIEFRHQLIQEHCTAESLLKLLPSLGDDELKREYLNYLKWTEPLALMLELVEDEAQAMRVVKLALEVDWWLGARLAGVVKLEWQEQTVDLIAGLEIPKLLKLQLLSLTKSERAIPSLDQALEYPNLDVRWRAAEALGNLGREAAISSLNQALEHSEYSVRWAAAQALGNLGEAAISSLNQALEHSDPVVRLLAEQALSNLSEKKSTLEYSKFFIPIRWIAADFLDKIDSNTTIYSIIKALEDEVSDVRQSAADFLGEIGSEAAITSLIKALEDEVSSVRQSAANALGKIGSEAAISSLIKALEDEVSGVRQSAVNALGEIGSEAAISSLIKALEDSHFSVRQSAADALGKIGSETAIPSLIKALDDGDAFISESAANALGKIGSETAIPSLIKALEDKRYNVCRTAADALSEIGLKVTIPSLIKALKDEYFVVANQGTTFVYTTEALQAIQNRCKLYNPTLTQPIPTPEPQLNIPPIQPVSTSLMHILHLSDLHFGTLDQANLWSNQLAADLYNDRKIPHLDALILSGDIANYSTEEEYQAAEQFLHNLRQDFPLNPEQIILVPGNHDLNWKLAKKAYTLIDRDDYDGELIDGHYIEESASVIRVRDEAEYIQRFAHFSQFYETIKQKPYPLDYDQQYTLDHLKEQNLLILGLNSAWQLDHHYKSRASIHMGALTNALTQIRRNPDYRNCLKIAVWHHPLDSAYSDRITDKGFLEQLAVNGFRFFLHGHIHKAETSLYRYDMSTNGRKLDRICAGTFGAPVREWVPGYPLQYNLLKFEDNQLTVYTRRREELNGAWKPDARWGQGAGKTPLDYYAIAL